MALVTYGKPMDTDTLTQDAVELMSEPPEL
jgi:hypothetical protein